MPRPPSERVEEGFQLWSSEGECNDTKTGELMGVPQETVSYWKRTYHLHERYLSLMGPQSEHWAALARAEMRAILPAAAVRLRAIDSATTPIYNAEGEKIGETWASSDRDAVQAAKLLAQYALEGGAGQDTTIIDVPSMLAPHARGEAFAAMSAQDQAIAILEDNVAAVNTRIIKRGDASDDAVRAGTPMGFHPGSTMACCHLH